METEYTGSALWAAVLEARMLPLRALAFRVRWEASIKLGLHKHRYAPSTLTNEEVLGYFPLEERTPAGLLDYFRRRDNVRFIFSREDFPAIRRVWSERLPEAREPLRAAVGKICRHEFSLLSSPERRFEGDVDWHCEFGSGASWPRIPWSRIDIRSEKRLGDIKRCWEFNRCQFMIALARAYVLLGDERCARELCVLLRSWIVQNPSEIGVNWYNCLECALRSISWRFAIEMTLDWEGWPPELFVDVIRVLIDHQRHMAKDIVLSERTSDSNHLLGDSLGIAMISSYLPELEDSARLFEKSVATIIARGTVHVDEDGVHRENAISYHRFVFYMFLLLGLLLERNGRSMPEEVWRRLSGMCEYVMRVRTPTKMISQLGDWDSGRTVMLDDSAIDDFTSMLCTGAVLFGRPDLKFGAGEFREEALWLLGPDAAERFDKLPSRRPEVGDKAYATSGHYTWRSGWTDRAEFVLFRCGRFRSHAHCDNLEVLYSAGGRDWLVDRGTYMYNDDWHWRTYFRHSSGHNVVLVDGRGAAIAHRAFRWLQRPKSTMFKHHTDGRIGFAAGSSAAFGHLRPPVRHARCLLLKKGQYLLVLDSFRAHAEHTYEQLWHIAPEHDVVIDGERSARTTHFQGVNLWSSGLASVDVAARVAVGKTDPICGWHSRVYGQKEPAPTLIYGARSAQPTYIAALFATVAEDATGPALALSFDAGSPAWGKHALLHVTGPGFDDRVCLPNPDGLVVGQFPAGLLWVESDGDKISIP